MDADKKHFWMAAVKATYVLKTGEGEAATYTKGDRETNIVLDTPMKKINSDSIDTIRQISLMKFNEMYKLDPSTVVDLIIQNLSYLGMMSVKEFMGKTKIETELR
jgi:hypothetical protein